MNSAETDIMEMLHRQAILARSKEMFIHELQIQGPLINIIEGIRYNHIGPTCNCNLLPEMHSKRAYY